MIDLTIKERLMEDFKAAMKAKEQVARDTISFARAADEGWPRVYRCQYRKLSFQMLKTSAFALFTAN